jgi:hypothetical protein
MLRNKIQSGLSLFIAAMFISCKEIEEKNSCCHQALPESEAWDRTEAEAGKPSGRPSQPQGLQQTVCRHRAPHLQQS